MRILGALFFPQACALCREWTSNPGMVPLCAPCRRSFEPLERRICHICGVPTPGNLLDSFAVCSQCSMRPRPFDCARAWGVYEGNLRLAVRRFKYDGYRRLAAPFAELMAERLEKSELGVKFDWIVSAPTHPRRKRERGYDHTDLLARRLSRRLRIPRFKGLRRVRHTSPQFGLDRSQRRRNLKGAFKVTRTEPLRGACVLLIDDVMTSGATVGEISRTLRREAAVAGIVVLVLARPRLNWLSV